MAARDDGALRLRFRVQPPDAVVSVGVSDGVELPGRTFKDGRFMYPVPVYSERVKIVVGIVTEGQCVEDAVYHFYTDQLAPRVVVKLAPTVRATDTVDAIVVRSNLWVVLDAAETFVAARDREMERYNTACDEEMHALGIRTLPEGEQTLVVRTEHGLAPFGFTFIPRARFSSSFAMNLLHLMCNLDADREVTPATLYRAERVVRRRVLGRCALVGCALVYTPDVAMTTAGLQLANLVTSGVLSGRDDCEGCTLMTWWAWCAICAALCDDDRAQNRGLRWLVNAYRFYVVVCSFRSGDKSMQHMCAVLMPVDAHVDDNAILLESTTRTSGALCTGVFKAPPTGHERDLVADKGLLNGWYEGAHLLIDPQKPDVPLVPHANGAAGVSMETLLRRPHSVKLVPLRTPPPADISRMLRRRFDTDPSPDLGAYDVILSDVRGPDMGAHHVLTARDSEGFGPGDNAIRTGADTYYAFRAPAE